MTYSCHRNLPDCAIYWRHLGAADEGIEVLFDRGVSDFLADRTFPGDGLVSLLEFLSRMQTLKTLSCRWFPGANLFLV